MRFAEMFLKRLAWFSFGLTLAISGAWAGWSAAPGEAMTAPGAEPAPAAADPLDPTAVESLRIQGLSDHRGKNVTVFYVSGREGAFSTNGQVLKVRSLKAAPQKAQIDGSGSATVPKVSVERMGFDVFNYVVVAVHAQDQLFLRNSDGSYPRDARVPDNGFEKINASEFAYDRIGFISLDKLGQLRAAQGNPAVLALQFGKDL